MAYSIEASSDHCYEGTTCLINKLGIRDEEKLAEVEAAIVLTTISISTSFYFATSTIGQANSEKLIYPKRERLLFRQRRLNHVPRLTFSGCRDFEPRA